MKLTINDPELDFVYSHSSMGRERGVSIAKEDIARTWWMDAVATTTRDTRRKYLATSKENYAVVRRYANLFPYERAVITFFEKDRGSQAIEKEMNIHLTKEEVISTIAGKNFETIAPEDNLNAAKIEIEKAIDEIAKKEGIELRNEDMEELVNLSVFLLKKISEQI